MDSTRRTFLQQVSVGVLGASAAAIAPAGAIGSPNAPGTRGKGTLVVVYLRGGADALSVVVPYADRRYAQIRPNIAIAGPDSNAEQHVLSLNNTFGFNPKLSELHALYQDGKCVPLVCIGSPHPTRSHFDAQDFMERGAPGLRNISTGWLSRYLYETRTDRDSSLRAIALQSLLPRSLRGNYPVLARPDQGAAQTMRLFESMYRPSSGQAGHTVEDYGARTIAQIRQLSSILERSPAPTATYPTTPLGRQMSDVAKLIKADCGMEIAAVDYGGWDHHVNEGPVDGQMGQRLSDVSRSLSAFAQDLGQRFNSTLVLVMSEFGRTVAENGNRGTDHGRGGVMLAVGGKLNGRQVYGRFTSLEPDQLADRRDLPVTTDFRVVFAESLHRVFGYDGIRSGLFPQYTTASPPLHFLQE